MPTPTIDPGAIDACIALLKQSAAPLTVSEIAGSCGKKKNPKFNKQLAHELTRISADSGIYEWPKRGSSRIFCSRPLREQVEAAFMNALAEEPLTAAKAAKRVSKALPRISEKTALKEIKSLAPLLISAQRILAFPVNRQSAPYFSFAWLERLVLSRSPEPQLSDFMAAAILEGVRQLQSGAGNYVRVDHLRNTPLVRRIFDKAAIDSADAGKLVLARYDGPRPVPDDAKANYVAIITLTHQEPHPMTSLVVRKSLEARVLTLCPEVRDDWAMRRRPATVERQWGPHLYGQNHGIASE